MCIDYVIFYLVDTYIKTPGALKMDTTKEKDDCERCPECDMPLEDVEVCNFCDWTRNQDKERSTD